MISPTGFAASSLDPNMTRAIEELASVINEVEQRVQLVKLGLAQSFSHLTPSLGLNRGFGHTGTIGQFAGSPVLLTPIFPGAPGWGAGVPTPFSTPFAQGGLVGVPGVNTPFAGIPASFGPFRL